MQQRFRRELFVYECSSGCHRYWHASPPDDDRVLPCEHCNRVCDCIGRIGLSVYSENPTIDQIEDNLTPLE